MWRAISSIGTSVLVRSSQPENRRRRSSSEMPGMRPGSLGAAGHQQQRLGGGYLGDTGGVGVTLAVSQAVVAAAVVDQGVAVAEVEVTEPRHVALQEARLRAVADGFGARLVDGEAKHVDAGHLPAVPGEVEAVTSRTAAEVERPAR